ncbi:MAG TPA: PKD domain-containing protein [Chryseosolibacter sp.]
MSTPDKISRIGVAVAWIIILSVQAYGQCPTLSFTAPATMCKNETQAFVNTSPDDQLAYSWDFCEGDLLNSASATSVVQVLAATGLTAVEFVEVNGLHYLFLTGRTGNNIVRLDFGSDPKNPEPVIQNLGNPGSILNGPIGLKIVKEGASWYGIVYNSGTDNLVRLNFGNSITNTPSAENIVKAYASNATNSGLEIAVSSNRVMAMVTNPTANRLILIDFGNSITNTPTDPADITTINSGSFPQVNSLRGISAIQHCGQWYGFAVSFSSPEIYRLDFGPALSNAPVITNIAGALATTRRFQDIQVLPDAGGFVGFILSTEGDVFRLDFGSDLTSLPTINSLGNLGVISGALRMDFFKHNSEWQFYTGNNGTRFIYRADFANNCATLPQVSSADNPEIRYNAAGTYKATLYSHSPAGSASLTKSILVPDLNAPVIDFTMNGLCATRDVTFNLTASEDLTASWDFGDGSFGAGNAPNHSYADAGNYNVKLDVQADNGCRNSLTKSLVQYVEPTAHFDLDIGLICTNDEVTVTNTTVDNYEGNLDYRWFIDNVPVSIERDLEITFVATGVKEIRLETSLPGCTDDYTELTSFVEAGPVVDFSHIGFCDQQEITFQNEISEEVLTYNWNFDDGSTSPDANPSHVFLAHGVYAVSLTALSPNGCNNTQTKQVTIEDTPTPDFWIDGPPSSCSDFPTEFINQSFVGPGASIVEWNWSFGDGGSSTDENPSHIFDNAGDYNIELTVRTDAGCSSSNSMSATILQSPDLDFSNTPACLNKPVSFNATSSNAISYYWEIGTSYYEVQNVSHTFFVEGNHSVKAMVVGENGCVAAISRIIEVPVPITPSFTYTENCTGFHTKFMFSSEASDPVVTHNWTFGPEGSSDVANPEFMFADAGDKLVTVGVTTESGCRYEAEEIITILVPPQPDFSISPDFGVPPQEIAFTNLSLNATSYTWEFGDETVSTESSPTHVFTTMGDFEVQLTASNAAGCKKSISRVISMVAPLPDVNLNLMTITPNPDGTMKVIITIENKGNTFVKDLPVTLDVSGAVTLETIVQETIAPFSFYNLVMDFTIAQSANVQFLCASTTLAGDLHPERNRICEQLNSRLAIITPHPNPVSDFLLLEWIGVGPEQVNIQLLDFQGKTVMSTTMSASEGLNRSHIDVRSVHAGNYMVRIVGATHSETHRIVVSH